MAISMDVKIPLSWKSLVTFKDWHDMLAIRSHFYIGQMLGYDNMNVPDDDYKKNTQLLGKANEKIKEKASKGFFLIQ